MTHPGVQWHHGDQVVVHRWRGFHVGPPLVVTRHGMPLVLLERCLVDAWPLLPEGAARRAPLLAALGARRTTAARVTRALHAVPRLADRAAPRDLLRLVEAGCRSELELWGHRAVSPARVFPDGVWQRRVSLGARTVYVDLAFDDAMVAVELDGAAWHGSREQRERDLRRDAALSARGWVVLRFSHRRLHSEPDAVRAEVARVLQRRRTQLRAA